MNHEEAGNAHHANREYRSTSVVNILTGLMKTFSIAMWLLLFTSVSAGQEKAALSFPAPLNHFYLTLDPDTYAAIENNMFLQTEFAAFERRTTVRADKTYTGIYFYGNHTYFEFFDSSKQTEFKQASSGLAFGVERPQALKSLQARLTAAPPKLITRQYNGRQVPWFYMLDLEEFFPNSVLDPWVMEYHPKFLAEWHAEADGANRGILRKQILQRYKEALNKVPHRALFEDVIGLTIAADGASIAKMKELCENFGYRSSREGEATVLEGPDIVLRVVPETASARGIKQVVFRVRQRPKQPAELTFGSRSVLRFDNDRKAVWSF